MSNAPIAQGPGDVTVGLLTEAADELAWLHREYLYRSPLSEGVPRITRLLQKIEAHTGHVTASPYLPPNTGDKARLHPSPEAGCSAIGRCRKCGLRFAIQDNLCEDCWPNANVNGLLANRVIAYAKEAGKDIFAMTDKEWLKYRNVGKKCLMEIRELLAAMNKPKDAPMGLRDLFAMSALQGLLANPDHSTPPAIVGACYLYADLMMTERRKMD